MTTDSDGWVPGAEPSAEHPPTVGVLALQGDVSEHLSMLAGVGALPRPVRRPADLAGIDGIVLPGGESTTLSGLAETFGVLSVLRDAVRSGLPALGTCAGMILLADHLRDAAAGQHTVGGLDVVVRRNAFGRQVDSFEADLDVVGLDTPFHGVFIRAPWVDRVGARVQVLATVAHGPAAGRVVAVRQGPVMATAFHPEIAGDDRLHRLFVGGLRRSSSTARAGQTGAFR